MAVFFLVAVGVLYSVWVRLDAWLQRCRCNFVDKLDKVRVGIFQICEFIGQSAS
mgnify:CR=1 FL=1